jgi:hypothetical protein
VSHKDQCFRSDGDWICGGGCTHDEDEALRVERERGVRIEFAARATLNSLERVDAFWAVLLVRQLREALKL